MAKAKAKAKAPAKRAARKNVQNELPGGYKRVEGFALPWDVDEMPVLEGTWGKVRTIEVKRGKKTEPARVCDVTAEDGKRYTVWESAGLMAAFDEISEGDEVHISFDGYGTAKKGQNAPKLYTVGYR